MDYKPTRLRVYQLTPLRVLLASLHTTLVLSHSTIHPRRQALQNLPSTLENSLDATLERIRLQAKYFQALGILAWGHCVWCLSLDELRYVLAVECHHNRFQDNAT